MSFKYLEKLSQDFTELLYDKDEFNVIIEVGKQTNKKSFTAHSIVLRYRSSYFKNELTNTTVNENNIKTIIMPNISFQVFEIILKYIYGGIIYVENVDTKIIYELMIAADTLKFEELSKEIESHIIETKASWLRTHFSFVYQSIFIINKFKDLENFCNNIIAKHPNLIFESEDFKSLPESALVSLLKRDDLQVKEPDIWDYVIMWGIAQIPDLPVKLEEWSNENFLTLKITLQQCLPHIRYFHISNADVMDRVKPYMTILDEQLWDDLIQYLLLPDRPIKSKILPPRSTSISELPSGENKTFSTIIDEEQALEILSWIDKIDDKSTSYSSQNVPYNFKLILRGSKDGFYPETFWNKCDGLTNTVAVLKVKGTNEILGGYNPLEWSKKPSTRSSWFSTANWVETKDSFIFSLKNGDIQNSNLSRVKYPTEALYYYYKDYNRFGLCFGNEDLIMISEASDFSKDSFCQCKYKSYENPIRTTDEKFSIIEYEIFQITKK
ncbi:hypothetical protein Glove_40g60 [Diversispora epigaea]|uniref:BTB domain-containing protein n=1 Tax=Diversispora epigaea TaxID=1348612 RepID=A0A397JPF3_9GLOM|nr:hypothetical protein Glove_40g60 [Diversispora epigaea]